jgi:membrane associated rhomboid family serine protease
MAMGIYDREYYRREGPSFLGSIAQHGKVCKWLIAINVIVFILQVVGESGPTVEQDADGELRAVPAAVSVTDALMMNADAVLHGQIWRLLTYAFLHDPGTPWHILFNMLFLWWFGTDMEDMYGPREFLTYYLVAAVLGGLAFQLAWMTGHGSPYCLGASGAVTAVLVLYAFHFPRRVIYLWFFLPIPIWVLVAFQVGQDLFGLLGGHAGRTAVTVHLAGAGFAFLYYKSHLRISSYLPNWSNLRGRQRLRVYREMPSRPVVTERPAIDANAEHFEAKLDAVLEKVARYGQSSLTDSERELLMRASEMYKRRRT